MLIKLGDKKNACLSTLLNNIIVTNALRYANQNTEHIKLGQITEKDDLGIENNYIVI